MFISNFHSGCILNDGISRRIANSTEENTPPYDDVII